MATIARRLFTSACGFHVRCHAAIVYPSNPCSTIVLGGVGLPEKCPYFPGGNPRVWFARQALTLFSSWKLASTVCSMCGRVLRYFKQFEVAVKQDRRAVRLISAFDFQFPI